LAVFGRPFGEFCRQTPGAQTIDDLIDFRFTVKRRAEIEEIICSGAAFHILDLGSGNAYSGGRKAGWTGGSDTADYVTFVLNQPELMIYLPLLGRVAGPCR
jgi:hypothetical protein